MPYRVGGAGGYTAATTGQRRIGLFWVGSDGRVWSCHYDPREPGWSAPYPLGAPFDGSLADVVASEANSTNLFCVVRDSATFQPAGIRHLYFDTHTSSAAARYQQARALLGQANRLWTLPGPARPEATARALDAVSVLRELAPASSSYSAVLASSILAPVSEYLSGTGRRTEAISLVEEALGIYRRLRQAEPQSREHHYGLCRSLIVLATALWNNKDREQAVTRVLEGINATRELVAAHAVYATSLANWILAPTGQYLSTTGRHDQATTLTEEALDIFRRLTRAEPQNVDHRYGVCRALITLATWLREKREWTQAAARAVEAVEQTRKLVADHPRYAPTLAAWILFPASDCLAGAGRHAEAVAMTKEALTIYERLTQAEPDNRDHRYGHCRALVVLAQRLWHSGDRNQAAVRAQAAANLTRKLVADHPVYAPTYGTWLLSTLIDYLAGVGRRDEAIALATEAVTIFTDLANTDPAAYGPQLENAKRKLADLQQ